MRQAGNLQWLLLSLGCCPAGEAPLPMLQTMLDALKLCCCPPSAVFEPAHRVAASRAAAPCTPLFDASRQQGCPHGHN